MSAVVRTDGTAVDLTLTNTGGAATRLSIYRHHLAIDPERHDLMPGEALTETVPAPSGVYDIAVHGPSGFLHAVAGDMASTLAGFEAALAITGPASAPGLSLRLRNDDRVTRVLSVSSRTGPATSYRLAPGGSREVRFQPLKHDLGYYDLTVTVEGISSFSRRFAGHLEHGPAKSKG
jgi:phospholipase C